MFVEILQKIGIDEKQDFALTGEKFNCEESISQNSTFVHIDSNSTKKERNLLKNFMELSERDKGTILALAEHLEKPADKLASSHYA